MGHIWPFPDRRHRRPAVAPARPAGAPHAKHQWPVHGIKESTTFFIGREKLVLGENSKFSRWRANLFIFMSRNSDDAGSFFNLPGDQVIEVGMQLEIWQNNRDIENLWVFDGARQLIANKWVTWKNCWYLPPPERRLGLSAKKNNWTIKDCIKKTNR
jgi:hypothetical protein